jgi:DNA polymerase I-like protein with 3'-5' exonuclease and polymerase domains
VKKIHAIRQEGYRLLHEGMIELSIVERNGIRIDVEGLAKTKVDLKNCITEIRKQIDSDKVWKVWRKRFGQKSNLTSRNQLATILFEELRFKSSAETVTGRAATDEEALQKVDHPFVVMWLKLVGYEKCLGTFLKGIEKEVVGDRLHPSFNLHTTRTYRSSSDSPNFQNFPVRDKEIAQLIRSLFIASKGSVLVENDFKGIEVSMSACYHHDPIFISYITTPGKDMHKDMAAQLYCLKPSQVDKDCRYGAKNKFVFPQFYGDYYIQCAKSLWDWIDRGKLKGPEGDSLFEHLKRRGIKRLGKCDPEQDPKEDTFEHHVKKVEDDFWNNRFRKYGEWRRNWYRQYLEKGHFDLLTGFRIYGSFARNAVTNYPVQGSAFHCLLWTLIQVNRALRKYYMKSMVVGQIHDSLIGDIRTKELRDYLCILEDVVGSRLRKHWPWIIVPMVIETEIAPVGGNWFQKKEVKFEKGLFHHPTNGKSTADAEKLLKIIKP